MKVVVITGSREFPWRRSWEIRRAIEDANKVIVGDQRGADHIAATLARRLKKGLHQEFADWEQHGSPAGPIRNAELMKVAVRYKVFGDEVICHAFPIGPSRGTRDCIQHMAEALIPVVVHEEPSPDGK